MGLWLWVVYVVHMPLLFLFCVIFVVVSAVLDYTRFPECVIFFEPEFVLNYIVVIRGVTSVVGFGVPNYTGSVGGVGVLRPVVVGMPGYACAFIALGLPPLHFPGVAWCMSSRPARLSSKCGHHLVVGLAPLLVPVFLCRSLLLW